MATRTGGLAGAACGLHQSGHMCLFCHSLTSRVPVDRVAFSAYLSPLVARGCGSVACHTLLWAAFCVLYIVTGNTLPGSMWTVTFSSVGCASTQKGAAVPRDVDWHRARETRRELAGLGQVSRACFPCHLHRLDLRSQHGVVRVSPYLSAFPSYCCSPALQNRQI